MPRCRRNATIWADIAFTIHAKVADTPSRCYPLGSWPAALTASSAVSSPQWNDSDWLPSMSWMVEWAMRVIVRLSCPASLDSRPHIGTHKGHHCQEGIRTWPGDYACRRAGVTVLLVSSSQLPGPCRRAARGQAGAPAAAQRRGRTSLTLASGARSSRARKDWFAVVVYAGSRACSRCVAGGVVSQAPIRRRAGARAAAMTMCPGPGCSVMRSSAALAPAHAEVASAPGA